MKHLILFLVVICMGLTACSDNKIKSTHPDSDCFYPLDEEPKIYVYRDVVGGLEEQFHRIYSIKDDQGQHVILERYSSDGRILEALNFNWDSLNVQDHMVVNNVQKKTKATLYKQEYFPWNNTKKSWFASKYEGVLDSTLILQELKRSRNKNRISLDVMGESLECIKYNDKIKYTLINPFNKAEKELKASQISYYAKGFGLVEWKSENGVIHYKLEQILSQKDWLKIISR